MTVRRCPTFPSRSARSMILTSARQSSIRRMWNSGRMGRTVRRRGGLRLGPSQGEEERRALVGLALDPDPAAVRLDDLAADGQAGARPLVLLSGVEASEELENLGVELRVDADPVVADGDR